MKEKEVKKQKMKSDKMKKKIGISLLLVAAVLLTCGCVDIDDVDQPSIANPDETIQIYINASIDVPGMEEYFCRPWGGVKIPNDWTVISCTYTGDFSGTMTENAAITADRELESPSGPDYYWWGGIGPSTESDATGSVVAILTVQVGKPGSYLIDYRVGTDCEDGQDDELNVPIQIGAAQVPALTPIGIAALVGLLSIIATGTILRKRKKR
jgi:hypothetical protein